MTVPRWLDDFLACPACRARIRRKEASFLCTSCQRLFPLRFGIPDFRLDPDPYISVEHEIEKVRALTTPEPGDHRAMIGRYYAMTPENPPELHTHYIEAMEHSVERGGALLRKLERRFSDVRRDSFLDLGCGTAGLTVAASSRYRRVIGVDVALRWLAIGKRRLEEAGVEAPLLCANAGSLPFRDAQFDTVVADGVLEHVRRSDQMRNETVRVLTPGGVFFFTTNNRYSLLPEPHVRVWGFGFLPRRWMEPLAWRLRRTPYKARLHSRTELDRLFDGVGRIVLPSFEPGELGSDRERLRKWWERLRSSSLARPLLNRLAPIFYVVGRPQGTNTAARFGRGGRGTAGRIDPT